MGLYKDTPKDFERLCSEYYKAIGWGNYPVGA